MKNGDIREVARFETYDGQTFETREEAEAHVRKVDEHTEVKGFLAHHFPADAHARTLGRAHNIIVAFLDWRDREGAA